MYNNFATYGIQIDGAYILDDRHTIRGGFLGDYTIEKLDTSAAVFPVDATGAQTSTVPFTINESLATALLRGASTFRTSSS